LIDPSYDELVVEDLRVFQHPLMGWIRAERLQLKTVALKELKLSFEW
jgi:hypothetical protein